MAQATSVEDQVSLDSQILTEQFYFFTVVDHVADPRRLHGLRGGRRRRKNVMSTAMKNILTIAVVTPTFYYFGWYMYGCFQEGWPKDGHDSPEALPGFCGATAPWADAMGPNLQDHVSARLLPRVPPLLLDDGLDHVGRADRAGPAVGLPDPGLAFSARFVWILDAAWGWSSGGWLVDAVRLPRRDRLGGGARRRRRLHARRAAQPRPPDREVRPGGEGPDLQGSQHPSDADGADAHLHRLLRLLRRLPGDPVDDLPRVAQHLPVADDARRDRVRDHRGLRGRVHGRLVREQGRPVLDAVRRAGRRHLRLGRRRRLPPVARATCSRPRAACWPSTSAPGSSASCASTTRSGRSPSTASAASTASSWSGSSPAATRRGSTTSSRRSAAS